MSRFCSNRSSSGRLLKVSSNRRLREMNARDVDIADKTRLIGHLQIFTSNPDCLALTFPVGSRRLFSRLQVRQIHDRVRKVPSLNFEDFEQEQFFRSLWESVRIERGVEYSLFTFGDSDLPYFLVTSAAENEDTVRIQRGQITISRARIITPDSLRPEFQNLFEDDQDYGFAEFLMARSAAFSNLKISNQHGPEKIVTDTVEEAVDKLNDQLDAEEEDRVAILTAPPGMGGVALLKYAAQRVTESATDNLNELRERGFLP